MRKGAFGRTRERKGSKHGLGPRAGLALGLTVQMLMTGVLFAQEIPPAVYAEMQWRMIGPFRAGKVNGVAGIPGNPIIYYMVADGGGVWKTADGGVTWKPLFDGESVASMGAIAVAVSNPDVIYVGTGVNTISRDVSYGNGVYKSTNGGETWQHLGLEDTRHIARILVDPRNPDTVLVAAIGDGYGPNEQRGVFRSTDGGKNWTKVLFEDDTTGAVDLSFEPGNPRVVYATLWHMIWKPDVTGRQFEPGSGLYKSKDGGLTWTPIKGNGLPTETWGRSGVVVAPGTQGQRVYLIIEAKEKKGGLFRSDDCVVKWRKITEDPRI